MKREKIHLAGIFVFLFFFFLPCGSFAENRNVSVHLWGQFSPFISGEAGSGSGAPDYHDAFGTGIGGGSELSWHFSSRFSLLGGIGYEHYTGKTYQDISFDDLKVIPFYLGGKFHIFPKDSHWNPYVKVDLGAARLSSVDISYQSLRGRYWDSSWVFLFELGGGLEYKFKKWGIGLEVLPRYVGKPDGALGYASNAGTSWVIPVTLGLSFYF
jgi:opacity protein-like surface antigen